MSLPDTAEYWWDVKSRTTYNGPTFRHHPTYRCGHYKPMTGNTLTSDYICDINCHACKKAMAEDRSLMDGLKLGTPPVWYYWSKTQQKKWKQRNKQKP